MPDDDFVSQFLAHTEVYESPSSFWKWAAFTAIAAVARDNVYRKLGDITLYPNIFTLLLADSAVHRKGAPVKLCEQLVAAVKNTKVISGRASIQAILDELGRGETDKQTGKILAGGSALFSAGELSAGIVNDPEAIKILTDIYDFKSEYTSRLRGSGVFRIKNVCFTMMAASNEALLIDLYDAKATFGGLLGRTFLVKPQEFRPANSLFTVRNGEQSLVNLTQQLLSISRIKGEFDIPVESQNVYDDWYVPFRKSYENKPDRSGVIGRIHTGVLKVAMILTLNYTKSLVVQPEHILEAIDVCMQLMPNYNSFVMASGKSTIAEVASALIEDIWKEPTRFISKQNFLSRHIHQFDVELVDKCISTLSQAELLIEGMGANKNTIIYTLTPKCIETFKLGEK